MRVRANDRVGAHQVAYVLDAVLADLFGLAERPAHTDDCSMMLFDPGFPGPSPLLLFWDWRLLGEGVPSGHRRAGFDTEHEGENRVVLPHHVPLFIATFILPATITGMNLSAIL